MTNQEKQLKSDCCKAETKVVESGDRFGSTNHYECLKCGNPCSIYSGEPKLTKLTCLSLDCPERKSVCCEAGSIETTRKDYMFACKNCGKEFIGGECKAKEMSKEENDKHLEKEVIKEFLKPSPEECGHFMNGRAWAIGEFCKKCGICPVISNPSPEEWEKEFDILYEENHQKHKNCNTRSGECACEIPELKEKIVQIIQKREQAARQEEENKWRKILNSGKRMYEIGKEDGRQDLLKNVREMIKGMRKEMGDFEFDVNLQRTEGYNQALSDLQEKLSELEEK